MSDHEIQLRDIILIYQCSFCDKINSLNGDTLFTDIYPLQDYGQSFTGETLLLLVCEECGETSELTI
jgi:hypothetical protein